MPLTRSPDLPPVLPRGVPAGPGRSAVHHFILVEVMCVNHTVYANLITSRIDYLEDPKGTGMDAARQFGLARMLGSIAQLSQAQIWRVHHTR